MQTGNEASEDVRICPYLGLIDDAQTSLAFPSGWNNCYHCKPVTSVDLGHQREYCLTPQHRLCIVYAQAAERPLPRQLRNSQPVPYQPGKSLRKTLLLLILLAGSLLIGWRVAPLFSSILSSIF